MGLGWEAACDRELTWSETELASLVIWIAEGQAGEVLGFCELRHADGVLELDALYVDPSAMGQGAGKALWEKAEEAAVEGGGPCDWP